MQRRGDANCTTTSTRSDEEKALCIAFHVDPAAVCRSACWYTAEKRRRRRRRRRGGRKRSQRRWKKVEKEVERETSLLGLTFVPIDVARNSLAHRLKINIAATTRTFFTSRVSWLMVLRPGFFNTLLLRYTVLYLLVFIRAEVNVTEPRVMIYVVEGELKIA